MRTFKIATRGLIGSALLLFALATLTSQHAHAQQTTGYVNSDSVLRAMPGFKAAQKELETYSKQIQASMREMEQDLQELYQEYQSTKTSLPPIVLQQKEKKIQQADADLQEFQQNAQADIMQKQEKLLKPLYDKINTAIEQIAEEKNLDYVFPMQFVLFGKESLDLTDEVIAKVNAQ